VALLPGVAPRGQQVVVQPSALFKLLVEEAQLLLGRVQPVLERLPHAFSMPIKHACCQAGRAIHPPAEVGGFLARFLKSL
jgi:hypothetical protein